MKKIYLTTLLTCVVLLLLFGGYRFLNRRNVRQGILKVGFIYEDDESMPYTWNFALAEETLRDRFAGQVQIMSKSNVSDEETEGPLRELLAAGCGMIFTNSYSEAYLEMAAQYPDVQFCQASYLETPPAQVPENYHTFKGEIYQGRYVSGIAAGMKLQEMIEAGEITAQEALVGYVASYPTAEVISGFTAFLLGVRSVVPEAVMRVRYINAWGSYALEKTCAQQLIGEGCVILSQHTDSTGPAIACEEAEEVHPVYFVGYNQSMIDVAPTCALVSTRINWTPYIEEAVAAVLAGERIESHVKGTVNGNDISAGFEEDWVQMLELNAYSAAEGTQKRMDEAIDALQKGKLAVFRGDFTGINPEDPADVIDLREGFAENAAYSSPAFHYILQDVIVVEE